MATTIRLHCILLIALLISKETDYCQALAGNSKKRSRKKAGQQGSRGFGIVPPQPIEPSFTVDDSPATKGLLQFLDHEEIEGLDTLEIGYSDNGLRGVFAKKSIEEGEYICAIPFVSTILVDETFVESKENGSDLLSANKVEHSIKLHKIMETEAEKWSDYFGCLPRTVQDDNFDTTPDFWSDEDIQSLEIPKLVESVLQRKQGIQKASEETGIDLQQLQLAAWLVQSRAFTTLKKVATLDPDNLDNLTKEGLLQRTVLIPFIDFINHSSTPNAEMQVVETKAYDESLYALVAKRKIAKGKEVRIRYGTGKETSFDIFSKYGFLPLDNQSNDLEYLRGGELSLENLHNSENVNKPEAVSLRNHLKNLISKM
ncbi:MAG: hypothetical protein SGBAC_001455 [Bacillariaceae sp.]